MKRMQLFEFEDFPWFPHFLRELMTNYLVTLHRLFRTKELMLPILRRALVVSGQNHIVDLCSGGGGPLPDVVRELRKEMPLRVTLTDLYPNREAAEKLQAEQLHYKLESVDAGNVPTELQGLRTMNCSFHHMPLPVAKKILRDAYEKKQALMIFEISDNSSPKAFWWLAFPVGILLVLIVTLFMRPLSLKQLVLTYIVPILPLLIAWDGATSNARTYNKDDLAELTADLKSPDYSWEIETTQLKKNSPRMLYLLGMPKR